MEGQILEPEEFLQIGAHIDNISKRTTKLMTNRLKIFGRSSGRGSIALVIIAVLIVFGSIAIFTFLSSGALNTENKSANSTTTSTTNLDNTVSTRDLETKTHSPAGTETTAIPPTQTSNPNPTPTLTPTVSPSPTPGGIDNDEYSEFVATVYGEAKIDAEVPLRIRGHVVADGEELIIIMNLTDRSENELRRVKEVNTLVTSGFAQAVFHHDNGKIDGKLPDKLRIAEVNNTNSIPKTLYVNTSLAREYYLNNISELEFNNQYWENERNMTSDEIQFVRRIDRNTGNGTLYNGTASGN